MKLNQIMNTGSLVNNFKKNYFYAFDLYLTNLPKRKEIDKKITIIYMYAGAITN